MEKAVFAAVLLIAFQRIALSFSHSTTYNHTSNFDSMRASDDGRAIMLRDVNHTLLYLTIDQNGLKYVTQTQLDSIRFPNNRYFYFPRKKKEFIIGGESQFIKLEIDNQKIKNKWQIETQIYNHFVVFDDTDGVLYTKNMTFCMWLYENQQGQPVILQLTQFPYSLNNRCISPDGSIFAGRCQNCQFIQFFKLSKQPQFTFVSFQKIITPFTVNMNLLQFEEYNRFLAYSFKKKLYIHKRNKTDGTFQIHQQIAFPKLIKKVSFVELDIWIFYTAVDKMVSIKLQITDRKSEIFQIVCEKQIFSVYNKIQIRENYTLLSTGNQLNVLYDCPQNCAKCNALRECHKCQEGYNLEKDRCRLYDNCLVYQDDRFQVCQQYCSKKCISCKDSMDNCIQCKQFLYNKEQCSLKEKTMITGITLIILTTVRLPRHRMLCMIIGNFQLYLYHKSSYDGIFKEILNSLNALNALNQSLMLTDILKQLIQSIKVFNNFNAFANWKYLQTEGMNANFVTNFIILSLPVVIFKTITFFVLNWIFYRLFDKRISRLFRIYSFKLYLIEMLLIGELPNMIFLFIYNCKMLFRISSSKELLLHFISVLTFGLLLITIFVLFFFYRRNYGKLEKYFYTNCVPKRGALQYLWNKYVLKAAIYGAIHALLFEHPSEQLLSLALLEVISLLLTLITAAKYKIFVCQTKLCIDFLTEFILSILNVFLFCKLFYSIGNQDLTNLLEIGIKMCMRSLLGLIILSFATDLIELLTQCKKSFFPQDEKDKKENNEKIGEENEQIRSPKKQEIQVHQKSKDKIT